MAVSKQWTRLRTLGRGASGAEVFLAADDASGELFAVKSATAACASALKREEGLMSCLRSPRVVSCIGGRGAGDGSYQLFLEFAPGGSLADRVASNRGLDERAVRGYAADVAAGLAYVHGAGMVHGDVKARNVVIGADGRAKLADFGCARKVGAGVPIIGGTPAFMAPEVARGEEQGPAADVWALGCTVVEMATGRAPWTGMDGNELAALHRIGYTETVPEVPQWLSAEAKDFLRGCLVRQASERCTAAQLLEHPFLASAVVDAKPQAMESKWVSPKSTLDAAFWESDSDTEEPMDDSTAERRIRALACPASALPEWDSDEGWIDVLSAPTEAPDAAAVPAKETTGIIVDDAITSEEESVDAESGFPDIAVDVEHSSFLDAGEAYAANPVGSSTSSDQFLKDLVSCRLVSCKLLLVQTVLFCNIIINAIDFVPTRTVFLLPLFHRSYLCSPLQVIDRQIRRKIRSQIQTVTSSTSRRKGNPAWSQSLRATPPHTDPSTAERLGSTRKAQRHCRRTARMHRRHKVPPHGQKPLVIRLRGSSRVDGRRAKASQVSVPFRDCFARWRFIQRRAPSSDGVLLSSHVPCTCGWRVGCVPAQSFSFF